MSDTDPTDPQPRSGADALYAELKGELQAVATPLLEFGVQQVRSQSGFFPYGATLSGAGAITMQAAVPDGEEPSPDGTLELLLAGLRLASDDSNIAAVAAAEWVQIAAPGEPLHDAIKVHVHHRRGIAVIFYQPAAKRFLRGWTFGEVMAAPADAIVPSWPIVSD